MGYINDTNIDIQSVRSILGETSADLKTLCISDKINMWSKFKPINYDTIIGQSMDPDLPNYISNLYEGQKGNYGIIMPEGVSALGSIADKGARIKDLYESNDPQYKWYTYYDRPKGGINSPYRLSDFGLYNHTATPFLRITPVSQEFDTTDNSTEITYVFKLDKGFDYTTITMGDLKSISWSNLKLVCAVFNNTTCVYIAETSDSLENGSLTIRLPFKTIFPNVSFSFTSRLYFAIKENSSVPKYYRLPDPSQNQIYNIMPLSVKILFLESFKIEDKWNDIELSADWNGTNLHKLGYFSGDSEFKEYYFCSRADLYVRIKFKNPSGKSTTVNRTELSCFVHLNNKDVTRTASTLWDDDSKSISSFVIPARGEITIRMRFADLFVEGYAGSEISPITIKEGPQNIEIYFRRNSVTFAGSDIHYKWKSVLQGREDYK